MKEITLLVKIKGPFFYAGPQTTASLAYMLEPAVAKLNLALVRWYKYSLNTTEVLSHHATQISIQDLGSLCEWIGEDRVSHDQIYLRLTLLLLMILLPLVAAFSTFMLLVLILLPFQMQTNRYLFIFFHFSLFAHINMDFWLHPSFSNSCRKTYVCIYKACLSTWV